MFGQDLSDDDLNSALQVSGSDYRVPSAQPAVGSSVQPLQTAPPAQPAATPAPMAQPVAQAYDTTERGKPTEALANRGMQGIAVNTTPQEAADRAAERAKASATSMAPPSTPGQTAESGQSGPTDMRPPAGRPDDGKDPGGKQFLGAILKMFGLG